MDTKSQGSFSLGLKSIELQLSNLFSDCGGEKTVELLDILSRCDSADQESLLKAFIEAASQRAKEEETQASDFEETLYQDLLKDFDLAASSEHEPRRLVVLDGGRGRTAPRTEHPGLIDLAEARKLRKRG